MMSWYSYFLLNIPEAFSMILLPLTLLGISIRENKKSIIWFTFIFAAFNFTVNVYMVNSLKPLIILSIFSLHVSIIFKMKLINGFIIGLLTFIFLLVFNLTGLLINNLLSINIETILESSWKMIIASMCYSTLPLLTVAFISNKLKIRLKIPLLFK